MAILIKNARVFAPKDLAPNLPDLQTVEAGGMIMTPGFFDQHIHVTGGGGEGGPATRTPELVLSELVACGTTDVVGVSGTDYTTRSIPNLLAKVRALQAEGVSAWMYTSNYRCPPTLLTDSIGNDLFFIPEVLGVKIALGDHRSSFPDVQTVLSMLADIRVGAMLAGKIGFLHIHNGNIPGAFAMYEEIVSRGFPVKHIRPTHCGRIRHVFDSAVQFALKGGWIDITTGGGNYMGCAADAYDMAVENGVPVNRITMSSDGHGSMPRFNEAGEMVGLGVGSIMCNIETVQELARRHDLTTALLPMTRTVAEALTLEGKGVIEVGADADLLILNAEHEITDVFMGGVQCMRAGEVIVKGAFEE